MLTDANIEINCFNISIKSWYTSKGFSIPLLIDIKNILSDYSKSQSIQINIDITNEEKLYHDTATPFLKQKNLTYYIELIKIIYQNIDKTLYENNEQTFMESLGICNEEDFIYLILSSDTLNTYEQIVNLLQKIYYYQEIIKNLFIEYLIEYFKLDEDYPTISLKENKMSMLIKTYEKFLDYNKNILDAQISMDYNNSILFEENYGKSMFSWSWREWEYKRLYITSKTKKEGFMKSLESKAYEIEKEVK